ncbi:MAG: hypothetical protein JXO22_18345 [Phycisphaerae bacterium]|nr:hypothetical protein [Phycisphaerae bacterium]
MKGLIALAIFLVVPCVSAAYFNEALNSTNTDVTIADISGFVTDDMLGIEVADKHFVGWGWPAMTVDFAPVDVTGGGLVVDLYARYHQIDIEDPNGVIIREAYYDAQVWLLIYDSDGTELDLAWSTNNGQTNWAQDEWRHETRDLDTYLAAAPAEFDGTQVTRLVVRSTNWGGDENFDYLHFANLAIVPEPTALVLLLPALVLLRRR